MKQNMRSYIKLLAREMREAGMPPTPISELGQIRHMLSPGSSVYILRDMYV